MSDVILHEFSIHHKIFIWDGEGTFTDSHMRIARHLEVYADHIFVIADPNPHFGQLAWVQTLGDSR
jgi:hypothetical protein